MTSAFPIVCVTVGDNLMASVPSHWITNYGHRLVHRSVRLVAAIPPLIFSALFRGITFLFAITGMRSAARVAWPHCLFPSSSPSSPVLLLTFPSLRLLMSVSH